MIDEIVKTERLPGRTNEKGDPRENPPMLTMQVGRLPLPNPKGVGGAESREPGV